MGLETNICLAQHFSLLQRLIRLVNKLVLKTNTCNVPQIAFSPSFTFSFLLSH